MDHSIKSKDLSLSSSGNCWAISQMEAESFTFNWVIQNLSSFVTRYEILSPIFKGGNKSHHSWQLLFKPRQRENGNDAVEVLQLFLFLRGFGHEFPSGVKSIKARFSIAFKDTKGHLINTRLSELHEFSVGDNWGFSKMMGTTAIKDQVAHDDTLKISCWIWMPGDAKNTMGEGDLPVHLRAPNDVGLKLNRLELLSLQMKNLLQENSSTDVFIVTQSESFRAHKVILSARSNVFQAMFQSDMLEKMENSVKILDFESDVVKGMLEYIYSGETPVLREKAVDLVQIADKYELLGLKQDCEIALASSINVETAAHLLLLSHRHRLAMLKSCTSDFIHGKKNQVIETKGFQEVFQTNPGVIAQLYLL